ncbi:MAG: hypothetical protein M1833_007301 [Piccolia ochrophora]|nr:MAG: hypothetical protein M1833_007301 [Piccolia ochrophora]
MAYSRSVSGQSTSSSASSSFSVAYIDQSRALLEQQRHVFEQERALFEQERAIWETERRALCARIQELEQAVPRNEGGRTRVSSASTTSSLPIKAKPSPFGSLGSNGANGPDSRHSSLDESGNKFWEGSSSRNGSVASRTFPSARSEESSLPSISETSNGEPAHKPEGWQFDENLSPTSAARSTSTVVGTGIDISLVQKDLDGISLKPSAVAPAIVARVHSPSPVRSPSPSKVVSPSAEHHHILSPLNDKLTKDAGHTPNAPLSYSVCDSGSGLATPTQIDHLHAPSATAPPGPDEESYVDEDPELKGPLSLQKDGSTDVQFLTQLDSKLLEEARKIVYAPSESSSETASEQDAVKPAEGEPGLRFKRSMNFGSAFGATGP